MANQSSFFQEMGRIAGTVTPSTKGSFFQEMGKIAERPTASSFLDSMVAQSPDTPDSPDQLGSLRLISDANPPPAIEDLGTTFNPTAKQRRAERSVRTEIRNSTYDIMQAGGAEELAAAEADKAPGMMETALNPIFDALSIGQYTTAGAVQEYLRTGSAWEAFKQAAVEFENALPVLENEKARKPSFSDVLSENGVGRWESAIAGLALGFILDPLNLVGAGAIAKGGLTAEKVIKNWGAVVGTEDIANVAKSAASAVAGTRPVRAATELTRAYLKGGDIERGAKYIRKGLRNAFVTETDRLKDLGPAGEAAIQHLNEARARRVMGDAETPGLDQLKKQAEELIAGTNQYERQLLGLYFDKPERMNDAIDQLARNGIIHPDRVDFIKKKAQDFSNEYTKIFKTEEARGIIDPEVFRTNYVYGTAPATKRGERAFDKMLADLDVAKRDIDHSPNSDIFLGVEQTLGASKAKKYETLQQRIMAGLPTETDIGLNFAKRGAAHVRAMNNRRLVNAVINDPAISVKWDDLDFLNQHFGKTITERGASKAQISGDELKSLANKEELRGIVKQLNDHGYDLLDIKRGSEITAAYVLPTEIVAAMKKMDEVVKYPDAIKPIIETFDKLQGLWKGYAVFSTGFHARNMMGNMFNNWLAGVDNPLRYGQALKLQIGSDLLPETVGKGLKKLTGYDKLDDVPLKIMKDGKELSAPEIMEAARIHAGIHSGMSATELTPDLERYMLSRLESETGKGIDLEALRKAGDKIDPLTRAALESRAVGPGMEARLSQIFGQDSPHLRANRAMGRIVENNAKLAHFIDRLDKGDSFEAAGRSVKKYLFDYSNLTTFEKEIMRRALPFYAWMRFNVPLQLQAIIHNPRRYAVVPKTIGAIESLTPEWDNIPQPDYFQEQYQVQLPLLRNDKPLTLNPNLPFQDLNRMNVQDVLSGLTPLAKVAGEWIPDRGYSIFLDRAIERYPGEPSENIPQISKKTEYILSSVLPTFGKVNRAVTASKRGELPEQLMTEFAGIKVNAVDTRRVLRGQMFAKQEVVRNVKKKLQEEGRIRE